MLCTFQVYGSNLEGAFSPSNKCRKVKLYLISRNNALGEKLLTLRIARR